MRLLSRASPLPSAARIRLVAGQASTPRACTCSFLSIPSLTSHVPLQTPSRTLSEQARGQARWSSSNSRWKLRQGNDYYARQARVQGLKSRAAFKLLEMDAKYKLFRRGNIVIDLGYAPGSWSQVAMERTKPSGKVVGIDIIPAQPPRGVSTIQGNFLSPGVQMLVKDYLVEIDRRKQAEREERKRLDSSPAPSEEEDELETDLSDNSGSSSSPKPTTTFEDHPSYIDTERAESADSDSYGGVDSYSENSSERLVDVVLSDMSAPWAQTTGFSSRTLSNPYDRMMNTSGMSFRDHAGSMDLCNAALQFASDTLRGGGHFVCKFYQGAEDKLLESKLKKMFGKVHREKPESSRNESREAFFVALRRKADVVLSDCQ